MYGHVRPYNLQMISLDRGLVTSALRRLIRCVLLSFDQGRIMASHSKNRPAAANQRARLQADSQPTVRISGLGKPKSTCRLFLLLIFSSLKNITDNCLNKLSV